MIFYRVRRWSDHSWSILCCGVQVIRLQCVQPVYVGCIIVAGTCYGSVLPVYNVPSVRSLHRYCRHSDTVLRICIYQWRLRTSQFDHNWLYSSNSIVRLKSFGAQPRNGWTEPPPPHQIMSNFNVPEGHILFRYQVALPTYIFTSCSNIICGSQIHCLVLNVNIDYNYTFEG